MHFLSLHSSHVIPDLTEDSDPEYDVTKKGSAEQLLQTWKCGQKHLNQFWTMWRSEYLPSLRERTQSFLKGPHSTAVTVPEVGDIVLIKENLPRGKWRIRRITELIKSRDKKIRSANVVVGQRKILKRVINLLYPIECPREPNNDDNSSKVSKDVQIGSKEENSINEEIRSDDDDQPVNEPDVVQESRPTRKVMRKARQRLKQWLRPDTDELSLGSVADRAN